MADDVWTIQRALGWTQDYLSRKGDDNPRAAAQWLLCEATGLSKVELYTSFDRALSADELSLLHDYVARRGAGEPLQYITGVVPFRHISVKVRRGVLIPRPETEVLVSEALACLPAPHRTAYDDDIVAAIAGAADSALEIIDDDDASESFRAVFSEAKEAARAADASAPDGRHNLYVADICTGSCCIACSIATEHPDTLVIATDIAPEAIDLARENIQALGLEKRVGVARGNLGEAIADRFIGKLDLVVSNPPYVPTDVVATLPREVADFEPVLALDGGSDGLDLFRTLATWALSALKPGGALAVELHETCLEAAADFVAALGFTRIKIVKDLAGKNRVLVCRTPGEGIEHE